jgi:hypothetical protein
MRLTKQDFVIDKTDTGSVGRRWRKTRFIKTRITNCWVSIKDEVNFDVKNKSYIPRRIAKAAIMEIWKLRSDLGIWPKYGECVRRDFAKDRVDKGLFSKENRIAATLWFPLKRRFWKNNIFSVGIKKTTLLKNPRFGIRPNIQADGKSFPPVLGPAPSALTDAIPDGKH